MTKIKLQNKISCRFSTLKAKPTNLFVVSLSLSGLLMMSKVPIFLVNLYQGGPHTGQLGAQVESLSNMPDYNLETKITTYRGR